MTRTAGRGHVNGYLILRDQVGTPIWLVQLEIPRSAFAQATRTTLYQTILLGLLVGGFTLVAVLLVSRTRPARSGSRRRAARGSPRRPSRRISTGRPFQSMP